VVRKWPYIILFKKGDFCIKLTLYKQIYQNFKSKIFRKTTRFKKYNLTVTSFSNRPYLISYKRRYNWKFYVVLSSEWAQVILLSRQLMAFSQVKHMFLSSIYLSYKVNLRYIELKNICFTWENAINCLDNKITWAHSDDNTT
jgi:hypothetical protein